MFRTIFCIVLFSASSLAPAQQLAQVADRLDVAESDWPWWRGPLRNGTASPHQEPPIKFSETENVVWRTAVPGRGHGSPTVVGDRVFLASALDTTGTQMMLCYDRHSGDLLWRTVVHEQGGMQKNKKGTAASSTPACDGERVYINFPNGDALFTTALDLDGGIVWQKRISSYVVHQGYGASPALYQDLVIVTSDNKGGGAIMALDRKTGDTVWERQRPQKPNYPSPILLNTAGRDQLLMVGCDLVTSYDPLTGATIWETEGATTECVTSTLTDGKLVYTSGGYPENHMSALRADGSAELVWKNQSRLYVPSLVIKDGYLYGILDEGIAMCWEAATGKVLWKARLGGTFSSSPVLVGNRIYVSNEGGDFFVLAASPEEYVLLAKNQLGDQVFATPTIAASQVFHRVAHISGSGERQEMLYCLGN